MAKGMADVVFKRFKKIMIPYFFLSFVYLFGKMFGGSLADHQLTDNPFVGIMFGSSPCFGAWFLWCLFVMTLIVLCLRWVNLWLLFTIFIAISYIPFNYGDSFVGLRNVQVYIMWVVFGGIIHKYYERISKVINIRLGLCAAIVLVILHLSNDLFVINNHFVSYSIEIIKTASGIIASFSLCFLLATKVIKSFVTNALKQCGDYCMDIYILSMFVLVPLRIIYVNFGVMNYFPYYLWLILATVLGVILPIYMSKYIVRRIKIFKILLLGG